MKKLKDAYAFILAGGIGSRFWPMSREDHPKQFLDILGTGNTLIQDAYNRYAKVVNTENIYVIANSRYTDLIKEQLPDISDNQILKEPTGKNTAACVAYAANKVQDVNENAIIIIAPSDHLIMDQTSFINQIHTAYRYASSTDALVTLGIKPNRPDTGYGYIQFDPKESSKGVNKVITFTEKPPLEMAKKFLDSGDFLWNSGMFIWSVKSILKALEDFLPEMHISFAEGKGAYNTKIESEHIERIYTEIASISVDNGILEKARNVYVLPSDFGWSDLGTWKSVHERITTDSPNAALNVDIEALNSTGNLVISDSNKVVVLKDLDNYFVIDTQDALLICPSDQEQEVKKISSELRKRFKGKYT